MELKSNEIFKNFCDLLLLIVTNVINCKDGLNLNSQMVQFGLESIHLSKISFIINDIFELEISPVVFYGHRTIIEVASYLYARFKNIIDHCKIDQDSIQKYFLDSLVSDHNHTQSIQIKNNLDHQKREFLFLFSGENKNLLQIFLQNLVRYLREDVASDLDFISFLEAELISFHHSKKERLAIIAKDKKSLLTEINHYISDRISPNIYVNHMINKADYSNIDLFFLCHEAKKNLNIWLANDIKKIAALWALGVKLDLAQHYNRGPV